MHHVSRSVSTVLLLLLLLPLILISTVREVTATDTISYTVGTIDRNDTIRKSTNFPSSGAASDTSTDVILVQPATNTNEVTQYTASTDFGVQATGSGTTLVITEASSNPVAQTVTSPSTDVLFLAANVSVSHNFTADGVRAEVCFAPAVITNSNDAAVALAKDLENVRLQWNGTTVAATSLEASDIQNGIFSCPSGLIPFFFDFDSTITFGPSGVLRIVANVTTDATGGDQIKFNLAAGDGDQTGSYAGDDNTMFTNQHPEYIANGNLVTYDTLLGAAVGNIVHIAGPALTVTRIDNFGNMQIPDGAKNVEVLKFRLRAGEASDVVVKQLTFRHSGASTAQQNKELIPVARVQAVDEFTSQQTNFSSGQADFNNLNIYVSANDSKDFLLQVDTLSGLAGKTLALDLSTINVQSPSGKNAIVNQGSSAPFVSSVQFSFPANSQGNQNSLNTNSTTQSNVNSSAANANGNQNTNSSVLNTNTNLNTNAGGLPTVFPDVLSSTPYASAINFLQKRGVISGYPDGSFQPFKVLNRAELLKIVMGARYPVIPDSYNVACFKDVPKDQWFTKYICFAKEKGIVKGYPDKTFKPSQEIIYVEALKMALETFGYGLATTTDPWFQGYVDKSVELHIAVTGSEIAEQLARNKTAELLTRLLKYVEEGAASPYLNTASN